MNLAETLLIRPWSWLLGGVAIGMLVPLMYWLTNTALGVSTGYGTILKLLIPRTRLKWLSKKTFNDLFGWRLYFMAGMIIGGFVNARIVGRPLADFTMGYLSSIAHMSTPGIAVLLFVGGFLLALGARIAGACTSGHGIHGIATMQIASVNSTIAFFLSAVVTASLIKALLMGGMPR